jgi:hypothetical protein
MERNRCPTSSWVRGIREGTPLDYGSRPGDTKRFHYHYRYLKTISSRQHSRSVTKEQAQLPLLGRVDAVLELGSEYPADSAFCEQ